MTAETERQEEFREARGQWLASLFESSFFGGMSSRFQVTSSLDKQVRLQEELMEWGRGRVGRGGMSGCERSSSLTSRRLCPTRSSRT